MGKTSTDSPKGFMQVTVQIGERRFDEDLSAQLLITPTVEGIDSALETGASRQGEWGMLCAFAETERDEIKANIGILDGQIKDTEAGVLLEVTGAQKMTVDQAKAMVQIDPRRALLVIRKQALEVELRAAADRLRILEVGYSSLKDRKDYVIERARNMRQEMQSKMTVADPNLDRFRPGGR